MTTGTEADLLAFGHKIGMRDAWIQKRGTVMVHFDLTVSKREEALSAGAIAVMGTEMFRTCVIAKQRAEQIKP